MFEYLCAFLDHMIKPLSGKTAIYKMKAILGQRRVFSDLKTWQSDSPQFLNPVFLVEFSVFSQRNTIAGLVGFQEEMHFLLLKVGMTRTYTNQNEK